MSAASTQSYLVSRVCNESGCVSVPAVTLAQATDPVVFSTQMVGVDELFVFAPTTTFLTSDPREVKVTQLVLVMDINSADDVATAPVSEIT